MNPILQYRESHDLSQVELAEMLGINQASVSRYEAGYVPETAVLLKMLKLGINVHRLLRDAAARV